MLTERLIRWGGKDADIYYHRVHVGDVVVNYGNDILE